MDWFEPVECRGKDIQDAEGWCMKMQKESTAGIFSDSARAFKRLATAVAPCVLGHIARVFRLVLSYVLACIDNCHVHCGNLLLEEENHHNKWRLSRAQTKQLEGGSKSIEIHNWFMASLCGWGHAIDE